jgi:hypothetical protein
VKKSTFTQTRKKAPGQVGKTAGGKQKGFPAVSLSASNQQFNGRAFAARAPELAAYSDDPSSGEPPSSHTPCRHERTQYLRRTYARRDGVQGEHVAEVCIACGANARGPGQWVGRTELLAAGIDPELLAVMPSTVSSVPSLFGREGRS